jgi:anti-sigma B factor antagonist
MTFGETMLGGSTLVRADGRIDKSNAGAFKDALMTGVTKAKDAVVVDMGGVDYISSAGLRSLMLALRSAKADRKGFVLAGLSPRVLEIFTISQFNRMFPMYPEVPDALAAVTPGALDAA